MKHVNPQFDQMSDKLVSERHSEPQVETGLNHNPAPSLNGDAHVVAEHGAAEAKPENDTLTTCPAGEGQAETNTAAFETDEETYPDPEDEEEWLALIYDDTGRVNWTHVRRALETANDAPDPAAGEVHPLPSGPMKATSNEIVYIDIPIFIEHQLDSEPESVDSFQEPQHASQSVNDICKRQTLWEAYQLAKENNGAPGVDGVTFHSDKNTTREHQAYSERSPVLNQNPSPNSPIPKRRSQR